jgi:transketolase
MRGGYVVAEPSETPSAVVIATGAEVHTAMAAAEELGRDGTHLRVVSMPCLELFLAQDEEYRNQLLGADLPILAVEMGRPEIWCQLTGSLERVVGVTTFGASAPASDLAEHYGFTPAKLAVHLRKILEGSVIPQ